MEASGSQPAVADVVRDIEGLRDDPCAAFKVLHDTIVKFQKSGVEVPSVLRQIEKDLSFECFAESQGR